MAKRKRTQTSGAPPMPLAPIVQPAINPFGPTEQRVISKSNVVPSEFTLNDGTVLVVTPIVADVRRAVGQFNADGDPLYFLTMGQTVKTVSPPRLRISSPGATKPAKKARKKK